MLRKSWRMSEEIELVPILVLFSVADPGSGAFLPPGSGIRDGAMVGSGISKQNL
jgi:hypothetical protein